MGSLNVFLVFVAMAKVICCVNNSDFMASYVCLTYLNGNYGDLDF
jgi:hypothetical protein